jgi:excisionase family DNA binding protein
MARRDLASGHEVSRLLELAQATADAAQSQTALLDAVVSPTKPEPRPPERLELSPKEAAMRMKCSEQYVRRLCARGRIKARQVGRQWLIDPTDIDRESPRRTA